MRDSLLTDIAKDAAIPVRKRKTLLKANKDPEVLDSKTSSKIMRLVRQQQHELALPVQEDHHVEMSSDEEIVEQDMDYQEMEFEDIDQEQERLFEKFMKGPSLLDKLHKALAEKEQKKELAAPDFNPKIVEVYSKYFNLTKNWSIIV